MASEIRVDKINSLSGVGTVTLSPTGVDIAGITTAATLRATTGIVTSLTAVSSAKVGSGITLSPDGDIFATGITTVNNQVHIPDYIHHVGDNDCKFGFESGDTFSVETGGTERLRINSTGQTIVGDSVAQLSTNAERPFQVHSINGPKIAIGRNDTSISEGNTIGGLEFYGNDANGTFVNTAGIIVDADGAHGDDDKPTRMLFYTTADGGSSSTERLRIDSSGHAILKTANAAFKSESSSSGDWVRMYAGGGTGKWDIYGNGADLRISDNDSAGNIRMDRPLSLPASNIVMGNGYGIDFSATADSSGTMSNELFDDYEEGTFSCTLTGSSSNPSYTTSSNNGHYVRVGNLVSLYFLMVVNGVSSQGSGNWQVEGIPFSHSNSVNSYRSNGIIGYNDIFDFEVHKLYVTNSDKLLIIPNGVTQSNQTYSQNPLSTGYFSFSITYITDS